MRQISVERADLATCVTQAQRERLVITKKGKPVALLVGIVGQDREQLGLATNARFWKMIERRRNRHSAATRKSHVSCCAASRKRERYWDISASMPAIFCSPCHLLINSCNSLACVSGADSVTDAASGILRARERSLPAPRGLARTATYRAASCWKSFFTSTWSV